MAMPATEPMPNRNSPVFPVDAENPKRFRWLRCRTPTVCRQCSRSEAVGGSRARPGGGRVEPSGGCGAGKPPPGFPRFAHTGPRCRRWGRGMGVPMARGAGGRGGKFGVGCREQLGVGA